MRCPEVVRFITKLFALLESLREALEDLSSAIRNATKDSPANQQIKDRISAEIRFPREVEQSQSAAQEEQTRIQRRIALFTGLAFLAASIYAAISYCQFREMQKQTVEANRAWVSIDAPVFMQAPQIGQSVPIQIPYINVGHGPAINSHFSALIDVIDGPGIGSTLDATKLPKVGENFCRTNPPNIQAGVIFPEPNPAYLRKNSSDFGIVWTQKMQWDERLLRLRACLSYESFGKVRYTWVCKVFWTGAFVQNNPGILIGFNCPDGGGVD